MKQRLSVLDIKAITNELNNRLTNSFIQNFYSTQQRLLFIKFSNKDILLIEPSLRLHLVQSHDAEISHFCKKLRELCRHSKVHRVYQYGYDRIAIIDIQRYRIVIEFFSAGNVLILGEDDVIIDLLRPIPEMGTVKGATYKFNYVDLDMSFDRFKSTELNAFLPFEKEYLAYFERSIKQRFNLEIEALKDEKYRGEMETFLHEMRTEIDSLGGFGEVVLANKKPDLLFSFKTTQNTTNENSLTVQDKIAAKVDESVVYKIESMSLEYKNAIKLVDREELNKKLLETPKIKILYFFSFNAATDYFFGDLGKAKKPQKEGKELRIKKAQEKYIDELENQALDHRETADVLQDNRTFVMAILSIFKRVSQARMEWDAFETFWESEKKRGNPHASAITSFDLRDKKCIINIEDRHIELDLTIGLDKNIENYFLKKKKATEKQNKTRNALDNVIGKLSAKKEVFPSQKRTPYWFEKFHFFISSEGFLVIGGKNAQQNDIVVKKHLSNGDLYFHGDVQGASSVICKAKLETPITETAIEEAAYMSLCMSKCWSDGIIMPVFYVNSYQVSKTLPNGDQAPAGTFIIGGKRNMVYPKRLEYGLGILFKLEDAKDELDFCSNPEEGSPIVHAMPVCAPWSIVKSFKYRARLCLGADKKSKVVNEIQRTFNAQSEATYDEKFVKSIGVEEYNTVILSKCKSAKIVN